MTGKGPALPYGRHVADALAFTKALPDACLDVLVTDPPWDIPGGGPFKNAAPYELQPKEYIGKVLAECRRALKPGRHAYVFAPCGVQMLDAIEACVQIAGFRFCRELVWDKSRYGQLGMGQPWRNAHEPVFLLSKGSARANTFPGRMPSILSQRPTYTRTSKPSTIYATFLEAHSLPGEVAFDPFCGLNPLATAAETTGRQWIAVDKLTPEEVEAQAARRHGRKSRPVRSGGRDA